MPRLKLKHDQMAAAQLPFPRATYYRWAQIWPEVCADLASAPKVLGGAIRTWRTSERDAMASPAGATKGIARMFPQAELPCQYKHRVAGLGSLGRQRFVALADWRGSRIAREAKALVPSAAWWANDGKSAPRIHYQEIMDTAVCCCDSRNAASTSTSSPRQPGSGQGRRQGLGSLAGDRRT